MSSIDSRIVEAKFDNKQFEAGVNQTLSSLDRLKAGLRLSGLSSGVDRVANRFNVMRVAAYTAIATIAHQATIAGERFVKSFTIGPLLDGFHEYETQLNSVQTILSNTQWQHKSLDDVNGALNQLNHYADKTIYNFSEMARNVGTFTAAGVGLDKSVSAIKGIANLAAVSGSNSQQASTAMYQLSQAISSGTVKLMDWNSVVNAGMGGKVFQDALMQTARVHGVAIDAMIKKQGSFRNTLQEGWLSSKILTQTLKTFTGDLSRSQLKQMGYTSKQIDGIIKMGKTAEDAATKVKTFTQLMGTLREAAGSGWTKTWQIIIGNFTQAKQVWTDVSNTLGGMLNRSAKARNSMLKDWAAMGGRTELVAGIKSAFEGLLSILKPIKDAFREIFPAQTAQSLKDLTDRFKNFADSIKIGADTAARLKNTFAGVFAVFDIARQIIAGAIGGIKELFSVLFQGGKSSGGILGLTSGLGSFLSSLDEMLKRTGAVKSFFKGLADILAIPLKLLAGLAGLIGKLFTGFDHHGATQVSDAIDSIGEHLSPLEGIAQRIQGFFSKVGDYLSNLGQHIGDAISHIGDAIANSFTPGTFDKALGVINTGLIGAIVLMLKKFMNGDGVKIDFGQGLFGQVSDTLGSVTKTMNAMQTQIKSDIILKIAEALALLTASIFVLSTIDGDKLAKSLAGVAVGFGILQVGLVKLSSALKFSGAGKVALIAPALIALGGALLLYATALKILASINIEDTVQSLFAMGGALGIIAGAMKIMPGGMNVKAAGLLLLGAALNEIAVAMKIFGTMSLGSTAKGLIALAGSLVVIAGAIQLMPKTMALQAAGLVLLGVALTPIAAAMKIFGTMDLSATGKALLAMGGALVVIAGAIAIMPPTMLLQAAGLLAVSVALNVMAGAMKILGTMGWGDIVRGLFGLAGALSVLAVGLTAMVASLPGAAALLVAAGALAIFVPVLVTLGNLNWGTIAKGLIALAAAFAVFGAAGLLLTPVVGTLLALSAAVLLVGAGFALLGAGVLAFGTGFSLVMAALSGGLQTIGQVLVTVTDAIPGLFEAFGRGIVNIATAIAKGQVQITKAFTAILSSIIDAISRNAPKIIALFVKLLGQLLDAITTLAPKAARAIMALIDALLEVLKHSIPRIAAAALDIVAGFLEAIASRIGRVIKAGADLIIAFIQGIGKQGVRIANAAMDTIIKFANGLSKAIESHIGAFRSAGKTLAFAIADGMTLGLAGKIKDVASGAENLAKGALSAAGHFLHIGSPSKKFRELGQWSALGWILGLQDYAGASREAGRTMVQASLDGASKEFKDAVKYILKDLPDGLVGGKDEIKQTIQNTSSALHNAAQQSHGDMQQLKQDIHDLTQGRQDDDKAVRDASNGVVDATKKLHDLQNAKKQDHEATVRATQDLADAKQKLVDAKKARKDHEQAIIDDTAALKTATDEHIRAKGALDAFNYELDAHRAKLIDLGKQYDVYTEKINEAKKAVDDAIQKEKQYEDQITQQYSTLPDIADDTTVSDYTKSLQDQVTNTQSFIDDLNALRDQFHLSDDLYKQLLSKGPAILPFVEQLLSGGQAAVDQLNVLTDQLDSEAKALGKKASESLYQAGVDTAQGLLKGLKRDQDKIEAQMTHIAELISNAVKKALKIKSPSQVMDEIGQYVGQGLIDGMRSMEGDIDKQGNKLVDKMNGYIKQLNAMLAQAEMIEPKITPVLDLSQVKKDAGQIGKIVTKPVTVSSSYASASEAAAGLNRNVAAAALASSTVRATATAPNNITFVQNNTSPKALSTADIYRQTSNQISLAKGALTKNAT